MTTNNQQPFNAADSDFEKRFGRPAALERQIAEDVMTCQGLIETHDIHEHPTSARALPDVAQKARQLREVLERLCRSRTS